MTAKKDALKGDERALSRREALLAGCAACLAACRPPPPDIEDAGDAGMIESCALDVESVEMDASEADVPEGQDVLCVPNTFRYVGDVADFCYGLTRVEVPTVIIGRDLAGFWAMSGTCTHFAQPVTPEPGGLLIRCREPPGHNSTFSVNGTAKTGPALTASPPDLANYLVRVCDGKVYVRFTRTVTAGTRVCP